MKSVNIILDNVSNLKIKTMADLHIGEANCDIKLIQKTIEEIKDDKETYVLLNGDLINNATKASVSDVYSERISPMEQLQLCKELFEPIKDKILGIVDGNHERRSYNASGIRLMEILAEELGISDRYDPNGLVIFVRFGKDNHGRKIRYSIYMTHGTGGGKKAGAKVNALENMAGLIDTDIYIHSHTHLPVVMKQAFYRVDNINSTIGCVDKLFVNTNSFLNYGGYGEAYEFHPSSKSVPTIYLSGYYKKFEAKI